MTVLQVNDFSITITEFFMKLIGIWFAGNRRERWLRNVTLLYMVWVFSFAVYLQSNIMIHSKDDISNCLFGLCNMLSSVVPMFKILIVLARKKKFFHLILYLVRNFLHDNYDVYETSILTQCKRKCSFFVCTCICFTEVTIISYVSIPIFVNLGKNDSERILPFRMWGNWPVSETPYFEIAYIAQILSSYSVGFAYFCIDNVLCIISLHLAGQFRILQYRLSKKYTGRDGNKLDEKSKDFLYLANNAPAVFKSYIQQHQALIQYCEQVEEVFSLAVLIQVSAFSMFICLDGYQMLLTDAFQNKVIFFFHFWATTSQLVMFSYSCDCIIRESEKLASAACSGPWQQLPASKSVKDVKKDLIMLVMRSNIPCCITGSGFFIVSLETCTRVLTTAGSYFTLLQETQKDSDS